MVTVSVDGSVLDRIAKIMSYLRLGSSGKILKKKKKEKDSKGNFHSLHFVIVTIYDCMTCHIFLIPVFIEYNFTSKKMQLVTWLDLLLILQVFEQ